MKYTQSDHRARIALTQAFLRFIPIFIFLALLSSILISYKAYDDRSKEIEDQQRKQIFAAMMDYRDYISSMTFIMQDIRFDYIAIMGSADEQAAAISLFQANLQDYPMIDSLYLVDLTGMETLRIDQTDSGAYIVPAEDLQDHSEHSFYQEAKALTRYQYLFTGLNFKTCSNSQSEADKVVLHICAPLEAGGQRVGYLAVNFLMQEYLDTLRTMLDSEGCYILMMDENGYLYNSVDTAGNAGYGDSESDPQRDITVYDFITDVDLTVETGFCIEDDKICSYSAYANLYDRNQDYILSDASSQKLIFLVYYDSTSAYINDIQFSYLYHLVLSWRAQLLVYSGLLILYLMTLYLIFLYDPQRFTNMFSDNRYPKSLLKQALRRHQFVNYYQPIINIQDGSVLGFEALSRWRYHGKLLSPAMFIDEIFHYNLGQMLDESVFLAVREDRKRMEQYPEFQNTFISVNCCQQTFNSLIQNPPTTLIRLTAEEKKYIVLELLENIVFNQRTQDKIRELYQHNILFAIDDFGTGNSNVAFIRSFENLKVKIDRAFVPVDTTNNKDRIIIEAFVKMFVDQGLKLIVEGAESREQIRYLKSLGIAGVQGFYFSQPMTIDELIKFIDKGEYKDKL